MILHSRDSGVLDISDNTLSVASVVEPQKKPIQKEEKLPVSDLELNISKTQPSVETITMPVKHSLKENNNEKGGEKLFYSSDRENTSKSAFHLIHPPEEAEHALSEVSDAMHISRDSGVLDISDNTLSVASVVEEGHKETSKEHELLGETDYYVTGLHGSLSAFNKTVDTSDISNDAFVFTSRMEEKCKETSGKLSLLSTSDVVSTFNKDVDAVDISNTAMSVTSRIKKEHEDESREYKMIVETKHAVIGAFDAIPTISKDVAISDVSDDTVSVMSEMKNSYNGKSGEHELSVEMHHVSFSMSDAIPTFSKDVAASDLSNNTVFTISRMKEEKNKEPEFCIKTEQVLIGTSDAISTINKDVDILDLSKDTVMSGMKEDYKSESEKRELPVEMHHIPFNTSDAIPMYSKNVDTVELNKVDMLNTSRMEKEVKEKNKELELPRETEYVSNVTADTIPAFNKDVVRSDVSNVLVISRLKEVVGRSEENDLSGEALRVPNDTIPTFNEDMDASDISNVVVSVTSRIKEKYKDKSNEYESPGEPDHLLIGASYTIPKFDKDVDVSNISHDVVSVVSSLKEEPRDESKEHVLPGKSEHVLIETSEAIDKDVNLSDVSNDIVSVTSSFKEEPKDESDVHLSPGESEHVLIEKSGTVPKFNKELDASDVSHDAMSVTSSLKEEPKDENDLYLSPGESEHVLIGKSGAIYAFNKELDESGVSNDVLSVTSSLKKKPKDESKENVLIETSNATFILNKDVDASNVNNDVESVTLKMENKLKEKHKHELLRETEHIQTGASTFSNTDISETNNILSIASTAKEEHKNRNDNVLVISRLKEVADRSEENDLSGEALHVPTDTIPTFNEDMDASDISNVVVSVTSRTKEECKDESKEYELPGEPDHLLIGASDTIPKFDKDVDVSDISHDVVSVVSSLKEEPRDESKEHVLPVKTEHVLIETSEAIDKDVNLSDVSNDIVSVTSSFKEEPKDESDVHLLPEESEHVLIEKSGTVPKFNKELDVSDVSHDAMSVTSSLKKEPKDENDLYLSPGESEHVLIGKSGAISAFNKELDESGVSNDVLSVTSSLKKKPKDESKENVLIETSNATFTLNKDVDVSNVNNDVESVTLKMENKLKEKHKNELLRETEYIQTGASTFSNTDINILSIASTAKEEHKNRNEENELQSNQCTSSQPQSSGKAYVQSEVAKDLPSIHTTNLRLVPEADSSQSQKMYVGSKNKVYGKVEACMLERKSEMPFDEDLPEVHQILVSNNSEQKINFEEDRKTFNNTSNEIPSISDSKIQYLHKETEHSVMNISGVSAFENATIASSTSNFTQVTSEQRLYQEDGDKNVKKSKKKKQDKLKVTELQQINTSDRDQTDDTSHSIEPGSEHKNLQPERVFPAVESSSFLEMLETFVEDQLKSLSNIKHQLEIFNSVVSLQITQHVSVHYIQSYCTQLENFQVQIETFKSEVKKVEEFCNLCPEHYLYAGTEESLVVHLSETASELEKVNTMLSQKIMKTKGLLTSRVDDHYLPKEEAVDSTLFQNNSEISVLTKSLLQSTYLQEDLLINMQNILLSDTVIDKGQSLLLSKDISTQSHLEYLVNKETECNILQKNDQRIEKLAEIVDGLLQQTVDETSSQRIDKVHYYYVQMVQTMYQWIEFLEIWILKISQLSVDQHTNECKLLEGELEIIQQHINNIKEVTEIISKDLPPEMKEKLLSHISSLQMKIGSTKELAGSLFMQISLWNKENLRIEEQHKNLTLNLASLRKELDVIADNDLFRVPAAKALKRNVFNSSLELESMCQEKLDLNLQWPGCETTNYESELVCIKDLKLKVLDVYMNAVLANNTARKYQLLSEVLARFLVSTSEIMSDPFITTTEDLKIKCNNAKDFLSALILLLCLAKKYFLLCEKDLSPEAVATFNTLLSRTSVLIKEIEDKIKEWYFCSKNLDELLNQLQQNSIWLQEKYQMVTIQSSNKKNYKKYIASMTNLQFDIQEHFLQVNNIQKLFKKVCTVIKCPFVEITMTEFLTKYDQLVENIENELACVKVIYAQYSENEKRLDEFQNYSSDLNNRTCDILHKIESNQDDKSTLFQNIQTVIELESEITENENACLEIENAVISLAMFDPEEKSVLKVIHGTFDDLKAAVRKKKLMMLNEIRTLPESEIEKGINLWLNKIVEAYRSSNVSEFTSLAEIQMYRYKLHGYYQELDTIREILTAKGKVLYVTSKSEVFNMDLIQETIMEFSSCISEADNLVLHWSAFNEISSNLASFLQDMQTSVNNLATKNLNNEICLLNNVAKIKKFQKMLFEKSSDIEDVKRIGEIISKSNSEQLKNSIKSTEKMLNQLQSEVSSAISSVKLITEKNFDLWNKYVESVELCWIFLTEQKYLLNIYSEPVLNLEHLNYNSLRLNDLLREIECNETILQNAISKGSNVKEIISASNHSTVNSDLKMLENHWRCLCDDCSTHLTDQQCLIIEWSEYLKELESLHKWIMKMQNLLLCLNLNRPYPIAECNAVFQELEDNKCTLTSLQTKYELMNRSSVLHSLTKEKLKNNLLSTKNAFDSLESILTYCCDIFLEINHEKEDLEKNLNIIKGFLNTTEKDLSDAIPCSKEDIGRNLENTGVSVCDTASHYASLQCMRGEISLGNITDFSIICSLSTLLLQIQELISKLSRHYFRLTEAYSKNASFWENYILIFKFLNTFRQFQVKEIPLDYRNLFIHYLKFQILEVYIHCHEIIVQHMMDTGLQQTSTRSEVYTASFLKIFNKFQMEWSSLETTYAAKMSRMKQILSLWQNYLFYVYKIRSWMQNIKKDIQVTPQILEVNEIAAELDKLQKFIDSSATIRKFVAKAECAAEKLCSVLNRDIINNIREQMLSFKHQIQMQENMLSCHKAELEKLHDLLEKLKYGIETAEETAQSVELFLKQSIPEAYSDLKIYMEQAKEKKERLKKIVEELTNWNHKVLELEEKCLFSDYHEEINIQKNAALLLICKLDKLNSTITCSLEKRTVFNKKSILLLQWNDFLEKKIKQKYLEPSEKVITKLQAIQEEIDKKKPEFEEIITLGNLLLKDTDTDDKFVQEVTNLNTVLPRVTTLLNDQLETLRNIIEQKSSISSFIEEITHILSASESYIYLPLQYSDTSDEEIDRNLNKTQAVLDNLEANSGKLISMGNSMDALLSEPTVYFSSIEKSTMQRSCKRLLQQWTKLRTMTFERLTYFQNIKLLKERMLNSMDCLEKWLSSKEGIVCEFDYGIPGHSKNVYLESIKKFENLKHCVQDNVHLLHSVNTLYQDIVKQELDVEDQLKSRLLKANDRWHKLYKNIIDVLEYTGNVLQMWEEYDKVKEHLLLFLTETDLKLTELENSDAISEEMCARILNEFKTHEDEYQRFVDLSCHLKKQSECSVSLFNSDVDEVYKYWKELYNRLKKFKSTSEDHKKLSTFFAPCTPHTVGRQLFHFSLPKLQKMIVEHGESSLMGGNEENILKGHNCIITSQSMEEVSQVKDNSTQHTECLTDQTRSQETLAKGICQLKEAVDNAEVESPKLSYSRSLVGENVAVSEVKGFQDVSDERAKEYIKDLVAALKEAEERMDALEIVLSELTPSGIDDDDHGPNFSRLLAACRSSMDVIQHLSHLLLEDISNNRSRNVKHIYAQAETLILRWEQIEKATLSKELRAAENTKKWQQFSKDLREIEKWLQTALDFHSSETEGDVDMEKLLTLVQKHKKLITQIWSRKTTILNLNMTGKKYLASSKHKKLLAVNERIKAVNDHWDRVYNAALAWQNKLQSELIQSSEFQNTIYEMELWLKESKQKIDSMSSASAASNEILHKQHTEFFALKQHLENCCVRVQTLLDVSDHLFGGELVSGQSEPFHNEISEIQQRLKSILKTSQCLLQLCTEKLTFLSSVLGNKKSISTSQKVSQMAGFSPSVDDDRPATIRRCCSFLLRVARASFPIQAILLLLVGAAIFMPLEEEEELSCRLSNSFASSLNPMLRYPDGPPPV
ncbi:nesprin-1-like isoform X2 [Stegodyphus dumicola]|uniref:nesprin-1-like isoform X2 n=1 Tax=Stegodyphus dumicola TaxID=202533 RepID=UPI0015B3357B|nr:nesprin-1-like isoform X2 [Stegodyphus dumicola]